MQLADLNANELTVFPPQTSFTSTMSFSALFNGDYENSFKIFGKVSSGVREFGQENKMSFFMEIPISDVKKIWTIEEIVKKNTGNEYIENRTFRPFTRNNNNVSIKLPKKGEGWDFEVDDKKFTPANIKALAKGVPVTIVGTFGVYYTGEPEENFYGLYFKLSGLYLNDKENHPKAQPKKTGPASSVTVTTTSFGKSGSLTRKVPVNSQTLNRPATPQTPYQRQYTQRPSKLKQEIIYQEEEEDIIEEDNVEVVA